MSGEHDKYIFEHDGYKDAPLRLNENLTPINHWDLEQKIMNAWQTVDDLKTLYRSVEKMDADQIMGAIDGLTIFAEMRFDDLWKTYEDCLANEGMKNEFKRNL